MNETTQSDTRQSDPAGPTPEVMADIGAQVGHDIGAMADEIAAVVEAQVSAMMATLNERLAHLAETLPGKLRDVGIPEDEIARITERTQHAMARAGHHAQHQAERAIHKAERRLAAAQRRDERRAGRGERRGWIFSGGPSPTKWGAASAGAPTAPTAEPVTTEERLAVLRMLQENRITAEQADQLLAALEGRAGAAGGRD